MSGHGLACGNGFFVLLSCLSSLSLVSLSLCASLSYTHLLADSPSACGSAQVSLSFFPSPLLSPLLSSLLFLLAVYMCDFVALGCPCTPTLPACSPPLSTWARCPSLHMVRLLPCGLMQAAAWCPAATTLRARYLSAESGRLGCAPLLIDVSARCDGSLAEPLCQSPPH